MENKNESSSHILNTSANLLGLCFIVLTSRRILDLREATIIDELTAIAILLFTISCMLSFFSMRGTKSKGIRFEKFADIVFLTGLLLLFITTMLISFSIIK